MIYIKLFEEYSDLTGLIIRNIEKSDFDTLIKETRMFPNDDSKKSLEIATMTRQLSSINLDDSFIAEVDGKYIGCLLMRKNLITKIAPKNIFTNGEVYDNDILQHILDTEMYEGVLLYVKPDYRGSNLHKLLMNKVSEKLRGEEIFALSFSSFNLINYYKYFGFTLVAKTMDPGWGAAYLFYKKLQ